MNDEEVGQGASDALGRAMFGEEAFARMHRRKKIVEAFDLILRGVWLSIFVALTVKLWMWVL